jgi:hypothetical protein
MTAAALAAVVHNSLMSRVRSGHADAATQLSDALDLLGALIAVGLLALTLAGRSGTPRLILALAFLAFVPGRAIVSNWSLFARWAEAAMSMILSITILGLLATVSLWAHFWHPEGLFQAEAVLSLAGLAIGVARRHGRRSVPAPRRDLPAPAFNGHGRGVRRTGNG